MAVSPLVVKLHSDLSVFVSLSLSMVFFSLWDNYTKFHLSCQELLLVTHLKIILRPG